MHLNIMSMTFITEHFCLFLSQFYQLFQDFSVFLQATRLVSNFKLFAGLGNLAFAGDWEKMRIFHCDLTFSIIGLKMEREKSVKHTYNSDRQWFSFLLRTVRTEVLGILLIDRYLPKRYLSTNGILVPKLFWPTVRKNCSSNREKRLKIRSEQFLKQNTFLTCYWRFLIGM